MSQDGYPRQVGIELYHLLKGTEPRVIDTPPAVRFHQETTRFIRSYPDGTVEVAEQIITDEIVN